MLENYYQFLPRTDEMSIFDTDVREDLTKIKATILVELEEAEPYRLGNLNFFECQEIENIGWGNDPELKWLSIRNGIENIKFEIILALNYTENWLTLGVYEQKYPFRIYCAEWYASSIDAFKSDNPTQEELEELEDIKNTYNEVTNYLIANLERIIKLNNYKVNLRSYFEQEQLVINELYE